MMKIFHFHFFFFPGDVCRIKSTLSSISVLFCHLRNKFSLNSKLDSHVPSAHDARFLCCCLMMLMLLAHLIAFKYISMLLLLFIYLMLIFCAHCVWCDANLSTDDKMCKSMQMENSFDFREIFSISPFVNIYEIESLRSLWLQLKIFPHFWAILWSYERKPGFYNVNSILIFHQLLCAFRK
jgi:hypothetical protein